ncbi:MAG: hypothetical protein JXR34_11560 [Bacteroidales bacterium]|nr:hypothetical protein [Bacteroidales bacterium]
MKLNTFEKIQLYLFDDDIPQHEIQLLPHEIEIRDRYRQIFTFWLDKPTLSDKKIIQYMISEVGLSRTQAYRDLPNVKILLGNVRNAEKAWQRFKLSYMIDETYQLAKDKHNPIAMAAVIDKLGKYMQLDKEEAEKLPYGDIVPQNFEPTSDVSVLGIKPIPNLREKQAAMRKKYKQTNIEDVEFIDVTGND